MVAWRVRARIAKKLFRTRLQRLRVEVIVIRGVSLRASRQTPIRLVADCLLPTFSLPTFSLWNAPTPSCTPARSFRWACELTDLQVDGRFGRTLAAPLRSLFHRVRKVRRHLVLDAVIDAVLDATRGAPHVAKRQRLISSQQGSPYLQQSGGNRAAISARGRLRLRSRGGRVRGCGSFAWRVTESSFVEGWLRLGRARCGC